MTSTDNKWEYPVDEQLSKDILKMPTAQAFDFVMAQFYFAGSFNAKIPVDWGRYMVAQLNSKLEKGE